MKKYTVDFRQVKYYLEMHDVLRESLDFPEYYGRNWDAFWDCITDFFASDESVMIEILGLDVIERLFGDRAKMMIDIMKRAKHYYDSNDTYEAKTKIIQIVDGERRVEIE